MRCFRFIEVEKAHYPITVLCQTLGVSRSGYHAWRRRPPSRHACDDEQLLVSIRRVFVESRHTYGAPRVHAMLARLGVRVGRKRVARLMRHHELVGRSGRLPGPRTTTPARQRPAPADLVQRDFSASAPNRLWLADITYLRTWEGWLYLAAILDVYSRMIVGWAIASHLRTELVLEALEMGLWRRQPEPGLLIHHSDKGSQYLSGDYSTRLSTAGITASAARSAYDNAMVESWFSTIKQELVYPRSWPTRHEAELAVFDYIEVFYNRLRLHSGLDMKSPIEYETEVQPCPTLT